MRILLFISFFCLWSHSTKAQQPYHWQLTDEDGLPTMTIYDLYQDSKGGMWICTDAGICRYNGLNIKTYLHPKQKGNAMTRLMEDAKGRVWCKNFNGQLFFVENDSLHLFATPDSLVLSSYFLYNFFDNKLWINSKKGLHFFDFKNKRWGNFLEQTLYTDLSRLSSMESNGNRLLLHTLDNNIHTILPQNFSNLQEQKIQYQIKIDYESVLYQTAFFSADSLIVFSEKKLFILNNEILSKGIQKSKLEQPLVEAQNILGTRICPKKMAIMTTNGALIFEKNKAGNFVRKHHLLAGMQISSAFLDREGNCWLGTLDNGIFVFPNMDLLCFNSQNSSLPNDHIYKIVAGENDDLLLALGNGIVVNFSTKELINKKIYIGNNSTSVTALLYNPLQKNILFYNKGLYAKDYESGQEQIFTTMFGGHKMAIFQDSFLLIGNNVASAITKLFPRIASESFNNKFHWTSTVFEEKNNAYPFHIQTIRSQRTNVVYAHKNEPHQFWIGYDDSLFCYKQGKIDALLSPEKLPITSLDITQCAAGLLWVSTISNGIYAFKNDSVVHHFTVQNGLPSNTCYALAYHENALWGGTNKGIFKIDLKSQKILIYNKLDGLISEEIKDIEIINDHVWAATNKGLISFHKNLLPINQYRPLLQILSIYAEDKILDKNKVAELNYNENDLKFLIEGINLRSRGNFIYEYRLLGLDSNWISLKGTSDFIRFQTLSPGEYVFEVKMKNEDGITSKTQSFHFLILTPYWQRWWFQIFIYLVVAGIVAFILTLRNIAKQKEAAIRNQMSQLKMQALQSQLNPHFVFNAMSAIQSYWLHKQSKEALLYHSKFAKLIRSIFDFSGSLSIHIQDEIAFLQNYIALEKLRFEDKVEVHFDIDEAILNEEIYLAPLLIQPLVENCFKHAFLHKKEKGNLRIQIKKQDEYLYILIQDDGVGRAIAQEHKNTVLQDPNRLSSMKIVEERLQILTNFYTSQKANHQPIKITDLKDENGLGIGTKVEVWIPIQLKLE